MLINDGTSHVEHVEVLIVYDEAYSKQAAYSCIHSRSSDMPQVPDLRVLVSVSDNEEHARMPLSSCLCFGH